jgi:hypothetical protein
LLGKSQTFRLKPIPTLEWPAAFFRHRFLVNGRLVDPTAEVKSSTIWREDGPDLTTGTIPPDWLVNIGGTGARHLATSLATNRLCPLELSTAPPV